MNNSPRHIAVFASGNGSNAENLIRFFNRPGSNARVNLVITNRPDAGVIDKAKRLETDVRILTRQEINTPETILPLLDSHKIDLIVLAGFMIMIPDFIVNRFNRRIINIHPSLLPRHGGKGMYGANVHRAVIDSGDTQSGITIHYVNHHYDSGQIIFQTQIPVLPSDTPTTLEQKIHRLEHLHYPQIIASLLPDP